MEAKYKWINSLLAINKNDFSNFPDINWANFYTIDAHQTKRANLLQEIKTSPLFKATKPYLNQISKGCQICGAGKWSCLFITNKCNAKCFYCPAPQLNDEMPSTQGLDFSNPNEYADYINYFDFDGVSFSGGEPLLYFERVLEFLKILRQKCKPGLYIWMYTNGILADKAKLQALAELNLNEIRFDIGATNYRLDKVKLAKNIIPNITIEIPAVPEKKNLIIALIPEMVKSGVTNLNLHQLRLTHHNATKLIHRRYNIISEERPLVLDSEIAALEIIKEVQEAGFDIGINYCSFHFKNRFQKAGYRKTITKKIVPDSLLTENGFLREFDGNTLAYKSLKLFNKSLGSVDESIIDIEETAHSYKIMHQHTENNLSEEDADAIIKLIDNEPDEIPNDPFLFKIWQYEYIENGLRDL